VDLHPASAFESQCLDVDGGQQVGFAGFGSAHAGIWHGTANSWVDLNPPAALGSVAYGTDGGQQGGYALIGGEVHASLWSGNAASWVDLQPAVGTDPSLVWSVDEGQQVGRITVGGVWRAGVWNGSIASWVDLSTMLPAGFGNAEALGISHDGPLTYVVGYAVRTLTGRDEALMWVSRSIAPTSYTLVRGTVTGGNFTSLLNSDDDRLVVRPGVVFSTAETPVQIRVDATAPTASPNGLSFSIESSASFVNAQQRIWLWDYVVGNYELVDTRLAATTDNTTTVTIRTNASRFIQPGTLAIRALVTYRAIGPAFSYPWSARIDKVWWTFPG
jgi:hypothetical protein